MKVTDNIIGLRSEHSGSIRILGRAVCLDAAFLNVSTLFTKKIFVYKKIYLDIFLRKVPATSCRIHERWRC